MATTATITLSSDISDDGLALTKTATLQKAGTTAAMEMTTGLARKTITGNTVGTFVPLILSAAKNGGAAKVYIANTSTDTTEFVNINIGTSSGQEVGKLYAGDWCFFPWTQTDANADGEQNANYNSVDTDDRGNRDNDNGVEGDASVKLSDIPFPSPPDSKFWFHEVSYKN